MSKNRDYAEKYAEYAKEQMIKYGIPASVTLAQGILESSNGNSELAQNNILYNIILTTVAMRATNRSPPLRAS